MPLSASDQNSVAKSSQQLNPKTASKFQNARSDIFKGIITVQDDRTNERTNLSKKISINEDDINQFGLSSFQNRRTFSPRPKKRLNDIVDQLKNPVKIETIKIEPEPTVFKCIQKGFAECGTIFKSMAELNLHQRLWHSSYIPYECKYCCKRFLQQSDCNDHSWDRNFRHLINLSL